MIFTAPLFLLGLVPFGAIALWVLVGRRRRQWVPFLALWEAPEELKKPKKGVEIPPAAIVFALLAALLALLAAAAPILPDRGPRKINILLDRGAAMSALHGKQPRFLLAAQAAHQQLQSLQEPLQIDLQSVPSGNVWRGPLEGFLPAVEKIKRTAVLSNPSSAAVSMPANEPLLMLTDQSTPHVSVSPPGTAARNVAIIHLAVRHGQAMFRLSSTFATTCTLTLGQIKRQITFDAPGTQNVFVEVADTSPIIEASIEAEDDLEADNTAWLVRRGSFPRVEPRSPVADELRRFLEIYAKRRAPGDSSPLIAIGRRADIPSDQPGIVLGDVAEQEQKQLLTAVKDHPVVATTDLSALQQGAAMGVQAPGEGWQVVLSLNNRPALAVREEPARQVWVGFESSALARTPSFVMLWTNMVEWAAGSTTGFACSTLDQQSTTAQRILPTTLPAGADPQFWPGVFNTPSGRQAFNAPQVQFGTAASSSSLDMLRLATRSGVQLAPWLILASILCLATAAATWEKRRKPSVPIAHEPLSVEHEVQTQSTFEADGHLHRHQARRVDPSKSASHEV